jgi:hypothetical protein
MLDSFLCFVLYHTGDFFAGAFFQDKKWNRIYSHYCSDFIRGHFGSCIKLDHRRSRQGMRMARSLGAQNLGQDAEKLLEAFVQS